MQTHRRFRIAGLVTLLPLSLSAQIVTWTGSAAPDSSWSTLANWDTGLPTLLDDVTIADGQVSVSDGDAVANSVAIGAGSAALLTIVGGGALTVGAGGSGTLHLYDNGVVQIGEGGAAGTLSAAVIELDGDNATLAFDHADDLVFSALISGGGMLTKSGSGTLTLTGNSVADVNDAYTFGGGAEVSEGTLVLNVGGYWDGDGEFAVTGSDTTLRIAAGTTLANDLIVAEGTVEIAGTLEGAYFNHGFTNATLRVLSGGAIIEDVITLQGTSSLTLESTGALVDSELTLLGATSLTLGAADALTNTVVQLAPDEADPELVPQINLDGNDVAFAALAAPVGRIINNSANDVTVTIGEDCGCGGGLSFFLGTFSEPSSGKIGLNIVGGSGLILSGTQTYTGPTIVDGSVYPSALFVINAFAPGVLTSSPITLKNGSLLGGDGTVNHVNIQGGGTLSPGDYGDNVTGFVGTLTTGPVTIENDSELAEHAFLAIDIHDAADSLAPGIGIDFLNILGDLTFSEDLNDTFTVLVRSIGDGDGLALNFNAAASQSWKITSVGGGIVHFDPLRIFVDTSYFINATGLWSVTRGGLNDNDLFLNYAPIPEPATYALLGSLAVLPALLRRRRRHG